MHTEKHFKVSGICLAFIVDYEILTSRIHIGNQHVSLLPRRCISSCEKLQ
jgi:hypothetical protein